MKKRENMNNKIDEREYKRILIGILKYFDKLCRDNNIKYSLIAGSLIGAIRHNGIIPWDDDIDVILMPDEYEKLLKVLRKTKDKRYKALIPLEAKGYCMPFMKIVDSNTILIEKGYIPPENYGVYIDVFKYGYINKEKAKQHYRKVTNISHLIAGIVEEKKKNNSIKNILKNIRRITVGKLINYKTLVKRHMELYNEQKTNYVMINWPIYGLNKDLQEAKYMKSYTNHKFEDMNAMIFEDYDAILTKTYGDYMTPPPKEKQTPHHGVEAYWKINNE